MGSIEFPWGGGIDRPQPGEEELFRKIAAVQLALTTRNFQHARKAESHGSICPHRSHSQTRGCPIMARGQHPKTVGLLEGTFRILPDVEPALRYGVFGMLGEAFPTVLRVSNGSQFRDWLPDVRGLAIKLGNVPGVQSLDFLLANAPTLFFKDAR